MEHLLTMDVEAMRRAGYATVDALVARLANPRADPVLRRVGAAEMRSRLGGPPPEMAASANPYCGAWMESAGPSQVELEVIDWFRTWLGMPAGTAGLLVTGGSAANLTALLVAREAAGGPHGDSVVYVSDQAHSSLARTARAIGLSSRQVRVLPADDRWCLSPETVAAAVRADRRAGRAPFALCASAGSTNTGAVDPLDALADVCAGEGLWLHVDAAYGGFAALTRLATVRCAEPGRLLKLTSSDFQWLADTEPTVQAELAKILAERLQER